MLIINQRPRTGRRRVAALAALAVFGAAGAAVTVPPARADTTDETFIAALDAKPVTYPGPAYAIRAARALCTELDTGIPVGVVVNVLAQVSYLNVDEAAYFTGAAIAVYCPRHIGKAVAA